jgi:hypothetical protein
MYSYADDDDERGNISHSKSSGDIFQDEASIPEILRSLIDQQKLQSAWSRIGKRLKVVESSLSQAQQKIEQLPSEYVKIPAYQELVEEAHGKLLVDHTKALAELHELTGRLSTSVFEEHASKLTECLERIETHEKKQEQIQNDIDKNLKLLFGFKQEIKERLDSSDMKFQIHVSDNEAAHNRISLKEKEDVDKLWEELKLREAKMEEFTEIRVSEAVKVALNFDKGGEEQKKLIQLVDRELVDPVRIDQKKIHERLMKQIGEAESNKFDILRQIRNVEVKASETSTILGVMKKETTEDLQKRPYTKDVQHLETSVRGEIGKLNTICDGLQTRTILKLNEFVDHVGKLHETIDDHEHCLRHHAEEIENRSTKYDLLLCQSQIDKCVNQDEYNVELQDLKKVMSWQTNKIENFGLQTSMAKFGSGDGHARSAKRKKSMSSSGNITRPNTKGTLSDMSEEEGAKDDADSQSMMASEGEQKTSKVSPAKGESEVPDDSGSKSTSPLSPSPVEEEHDEEGDDAFNEPHERARRFSVISASTSSQLGQQVEALAKSLLCVAHLALAKPKLGTSHQQTDAQKLEVLEELMSVRHWITHKALPPNWDPNKLTTMALQVGTILQATNRSASRAAENRQPTSARKSVLKGMSPNTSVDDLMSHSSSAKKLAMGESNPKKFDKQRSRLLVLTNELKGSASGDLDTETAHLSESLTLDMKRNGGPADVFAKTAQTLPEAKSKIALWSQRVKNLKADRVNLTGMTTLPPLSINGPHSAR